MVMVIVVVMVRVPALDVRFTVLPAAWKSPGRDKYERV
jgi:hypothetical protein